MAKAIITPPQERSGKMLISAVHLLHNRAILSMETVCVNRTKLKQRRLIAVVPPAALDKRTEKLVIINTALINKTCYKWEDNNTCSERITTWMHKRWKKPRRQKM